MLCDSKDCVGCGACVNVCPISCITMEGDQSGFLKPLISDKCIKCGTCTHTCPVLNNVKIEKRRSPILYAVENKDKQDLKRSASGGVFILLANAILKQGGSVWGARMREDFKVYIECATTVEEAKQFSGSKYVQSRVGCSYQGVLEQLEESRIVLYTALPCQVAGLYSFLNERKIGDKIRNLYTADIVCGGVASEKAFAEYMRYMQDNTEKKIVGINQTDKTYEWSPLILKNICISYEDGTKEVHSSEKDSYLTGYFNGINHNTACEKCFAATLPRFSDITFGDFFGLGAIKKYQFHSKYGVSMLLINSKRGEELFKLVKDGAWYEQRDLEEILLFNRALWRCKGRSSERNLFYQDLGNMTYENIRSKYLDMNKKEKKKRKIKNLVKFVLGHGNVVKGIYLYKCINGEKREVKKELEKIQRM